MAEGLDLQEVPVLSSSSVQQSWLVGHHRHSPGRGDATHLPKLVELFSLKTQDLFSGWKVAVTDHERWLQSVLNNVVYYLNEPPDYHQNESDYALPDSEDTVSRVRWEELC